MDTTKAVVDTVLAAHAIANASGFFSGILPGIDPRIVALLAKAICSIPIIATLLANEWIGKRLQAFSPAVETYLAPFWARVKPIANPLIGIILSGTIFGDATLGLIAGGLWSAGKSAVKTIGNQDAAGISRAKAVGLLLGFMLAVSSSSARADDTFIQKKPVTLMSQMVPALGGGIRYRLVEGEQGAPWLGAQLGFTPTNHLAVRPLLRRVFDKRGNYWEVEAGLWVVF